MRCMKASGAPGSRSWPAKKDPRGVFANSKLRASGTRMSRNRRIESLGPPKPVDNTMVIHRTFLVYWRPFGTINNKLKYPN